jgi:shikimate kinase
MMKLTVVIEIPDQTVAQVTKDIHDMDEIESGQGIALQFVTAFDVMGALYAGQIGYEYKISEDRLED